MSPRAAVEAALTLLAAGRLPTIEAVAVSADTGSRGRSYPLTSIGIDQTAPCAPDALRLGEDGVPAETMRALCGNGVLRRITIIRNDAVPYGAGDTNQRLSGTDRSIAYARDDEFADLARRLGLTAVDVSGSASYRAARAGHMQANTPALLVTSGATGSVMRADAFADGYIVGVAILAPAEIPS